jgi:hypothetical protein
MDRVHVENLGQHRVYSLQISDQFLIGFRGHDGIRKARAAAAENSALCLVSAARPAHPYE